MLSPTSPKSYPSRYAREEGNSNQRKIGVITSVLGGVGGAALVVNGKPEAGKALLIGSLGSFLYTINAQKLEWSKFFEAGFVAGVSTFSGHVIQNSVSDLSLISRLPMFVQRLLTQTCVVETVTSRAIFDLLDTGVFQPEDTLSMGIGALVSSPSSLTILNERPSRLNFSFLEACKSFVEINIYYTMKFLLNGMPEPSPEGVRAMQIFVPVSKGIFCFLAFNTLSEKITEIS